MRTPKFLIEHDGQFFVEYGATEAVARKAWARKNKIDPAKAENAAMTCVSVAKPAEEPMPAKAAASKPRRAAGIYGGKPKAENEAAPASVDPTDTSVADGEVRDGGTIQ